MNVCIIPMGVDEFPVDSTSNILKETFNFDPNICRGREIPTKAADTNVFHRYFKSDFREYDAKKLLSSVESPAQCQKTLLLIDKDLTLSGKPFVFGCTYLDGDLGVISINRLQSEDEEKYRNRIHKQAIKITGYMCGMVHCENSNCVLYQTHDTADLDSTNKSFCFDCRKQYDVLSNDEDINNGGSNADYLEDTEGTDTKIYKSNDKETT